MSDDGRGSEGTGLMTMALLVMCWWFFLFAVGSGLLAARKRRSVAGWVVLGLLCGPFAFVVLLLVPTLPDVDPARPHRYLLGIACDGQVDHGVPTARARDRGRGTALEGHAWTMHRIWAWAWLMHRIWPREWLRDSDTALLRLYHRLQQQVTPPVTPSTVAKGSVHARCGGPLSMITRFCDRCGAPAGLPTDLATPAVTAKSQGPTGTHVISPTPSAGLSPQAQTSGPLAVGTVLNGRYRITQELGKGAF